MMFSHLLESVKIIKHTLKFEYLGIRYLIYIGAAIIIGYLGNTKYFLCTD